MKHGFRFFAPKIKDGKITIDDSELIRRMSKVLRFSKGSTFYAFDGAGNEYFARIDSMGKNSIECSIIKKEFKEEGYKINVFASLIRKNRFETAVEKLVEIGVKSITPVISKHSEIKSISAERMEVIAKDAAGQSGKVFIPKIHPPANLGKAMDRRGLNIILCRSDFSKTIHELKDKIMSAKEINIFVGPEGDFSDEEIKMFKDKNFEFLSLGEENFRSDTAAIVGTYLVSSFSR